MATQPATNTVATALLNLLATAKFNLYAGNNLSFVTARRRFQKWDEVGEGNMPALFLWEPGEMFGWQAEPLAKNTQRYEAIIYLTAPADLTQDPIQDLDAVKDAIFNVLKPSGGLKIFGKQTLGGLVEHCRIEGEIVKASGDIDNISLLIIPIRVLLGTPIV
jgi:hypothetical protein